MINEKQVMILSHDYANVSSRDPLSNTTVRPYIFDIESRTWNLTISTPAFSENANNFRMRTMHTTVIHDGIIYTLGGADFYGDIKVALNTSWYYNIQTHSYGLINNNGFDYRSIGGRSFNLP